MSLIISYTLFPSIFRLNLGTLTRSLSGSSAQQEAAADQHHRHFAPILSRKHHPNATPILQRRCSLRDLCQLCDIHPPQHKHTRARTHACTNGIMRCSCCSSLPHSCSLGPNNTVLVLRYPPQRFSPLLWVQRDRASGTGAFIRPLSN